MAGLKTIKSKIKSVEKTRKVTKAMEAVSASKMRKAQTVALRGRAYARAAAGVLARVAGSRELVNHPLVRGAIDAASLTLGVERPTSAFASATSIAPSRVLYIVVTSDKGLAGALNSGVLRATQADIIRNGLSTEQVSIVAVGRKANDFFTARGFRIEAYHPNTEDVSAHIVRTLVDEAAARFAASEVDKVLVAYQNFISTFEQRPTLRQVFPLSLEELQKVVADIVPKRGVFADTEAEVSQPSTYTLEPSEADVLNVILPMLASVIVYHALLESQASEHSARMVSMKSASDKAGEMTEALTLRFNKARQASITREVSEITGGMEAMAG